MRRFISIILVISSHYGNAQYDKEGAEQLLRTALSSWQTGDTAVTMRHLHDFYARYPDNVVSAMVCLRLGNLYASMNKIDSAVFILNEGLRTERKWRCIYPDSTGLFYSLSTFMLWKANCCLLLSKLAEQAGDYKLSLNYLVLADTKYVPFWHCATGIDDFRADLSPQIADAYLKLHDTVGAINRLLKYFLYDHDVVQKLKPLLLTKYSQQEITRELNRSIASFKIDGDDLIYSAFGVEIMRDRYSKDDKKSLRKYLNTNQRMNYLRDYPQVIPTFH